MEQKVNENKPTILSSFFWKAMERASAQIINLLIQIILARLLMPSDFGGLAILVAIINYAATFVQSGLSTAIIQKQDLEIQDISSVLTASLLVAMIMYFMLYVLSPILAVFYAMLELEPTLRVMALLLLLDAVISVQTAVLMREMLFKTIFTRTMLATIISGFVGIAMAYAGCGLWALVAQQLLIRVINVLIMSLDKNLRFPLSFSWNRARTIYRFSGKILLTNMITGFHEMLRTMVIGRKYSTTDLAYYDKAYAYANYVTQVVNVSMSSVLLPVFSRSQNNLEDLRDMVRKSVGLSSYIMFPVLLGVAVIAEPLIRVLLTEKWILCAPYLAIFCVFRIPGCIVTADKQVCYAMGKSGTILIYEIVLFIMNICTLIFCMPYGVMAIAIGATLVEYMGTIVVWLITAKLIQYKLLDRIKDISKVASNSFLMASLVWVIGRLELPSYQLMLIQIITGILTYAVLSIFTKDPNFVYFLKILLKLKKEKK